MKKDAHVLLIWVLSIICFFISVTSLSAEPLTPKNFAFGIPITVKESATVYSLSIPKSVYQNIDRKDFGDIRIFNSSNTMVAHSIKTKADKNPSKLPSKTLPFFPIAKSGNNGKNTFSLNVNTDTKGAIINVRSNTPKENDNRFYYLIDLSALKIMPEKLLFKWWNADKSFNIKTILEYSNNLTDWTTMKTDTTLAALNFSGNVLIKDKIKLNSVKTKYLRLEWPVPLTEAKIIKIEAVFPAQSRSFPLEWEFFPSESIDQKNNIIEYQIKGFFPFSTVCLDLPEENTVFKAQLKSRPDKDSEWKLRYSGLFYNININGTPLTSEPLKINSGADQYWQLKFLSQTPDLTHSAPLLKIGWIPHDIYFLNQGQPPFTLAFGNYEVPPSQNLVDQLFSNMDEEKKKSMVKPAVAGKSYPLGEKKTKPSSLPWQKWALWAVLISGVCLLGIMALKLFKQINSDL